MKRLVVALLAVLLAGAAACGGGDDGADPPPTTTAPSTTEPSDEEQLTQLAEDWYAAARDIGIDGEPASTADEYLTGGYLARFQDEIARREEQGLRVQRDPQGRSSSEVESIEVDGDRAQVTQCIVDGDILIEAGNDAAPNDSVVAKRMRSTATRTPEGWRFEARETLEEWEGRQECPAS